MTRSIATRIYLARHGRTRLNAAGGIAVVVSHDVVIRSLLATLDPDLGVVDAIPQETGCLNILGRTDGAWAVLCVNRMPGEPGEQSRELQLGA